MRPTLSQVRARVLAGQSTKDEYGEGLLYEPMEETDWRYTKNGTPLSEQTLQRIRESASRYQSRRKAHRRQEIEARVFAAVQDGPRLLKDVAVSLGMDPRAVGWSARMSDRLETYYADRLKLLKLIRVKQ